MLHLTFSKERKRGGKKEGSVHVYVLEFFKTLGTSPDIYMLYTQYICDTHKINSHFSDIIKIRFKIFSVGKLYVYDEWMWLMLNLNSVFLTRVSMEHFIIKVNSLKSCCPSGILMFTL